MARNQRTPPRIPHWPDSVDTLDSEQARNQYHLWEDYSDSDITRPMDDYNEPSDNFTHPVIQSRSPLEFYNSNEEDRIIAMRRRHSYQADDRETVDDTPPHRLFPRHTSPSNIPQQPFPHSTTPVSTNNMPRRQQEQAERRRELAYELKLGEHRVSLLSKPTVPGCRVGKSLLWLTLAIISVGILANGVAFLCGS